MYHNPFWKEELELNGKIYAGLWFLLIRNRYIA